MPLVSRDKVWGYAGIDIVGEHRSWTNEDCQWFASLVNIIGLCLELQRSEQAAQDDRLYLQSLYRHMPLGYVRMKLLYGEDGALCDYRIVETNDATDEIVGASRETYIGRTASELGIDLEKHLAGPAEVLSDGQLRRRRHLRRPRGPLPALCSLLHGRGRDHGLFPRPDRNPPGTRDDPAQ